MILGGVHGIVTWQVAALALGPQALLAVVIAVDGTLVFSNDAVCLAVTPVLADACQRRRLDPVPWSRTAWPRARPWRFG